MVQTANSSSSPPCFARELVKIAMGFGMWRRRHQANLEEADAKRGRPDPRRELPQPASRNEGRGGCSHGANGNLISSRHVRPGYIFRCGNVDVDSVEANFGSDCAALFALHDMATTTLTPTSATMESPKLVKKAAAVEVEKKAPTTPMRASAGCR